MKGRLGTSTKMIRPREAPKMSYSQRMELAWKIQKILFSKEPADIIAKKVTLKSESQFNRAIKKLALGDTREKIQVAYWCLKIRK